MANILGHDALREELARPDHPAATLIEGPAGIGKRLVAREAAAKRARGPNLIEVGRTVCTSSVNGEDCAGHSNPRKNCEVTTASVADHISERARVRSRGHRTVLFDAGLATTGAANGLLKLLEEPPPNLSFILWADGPVLPTIASRAERLTASPLSDADMQSLLDSWGVPADRTATVARMSAGRPGRARELDDVVRQKGSVLQLLKAGMEDDAILLTNACRALAPASKEDYDEVRALGDTLRGRRTIDLLRTAICEARTGTHVAFEREELFGLERLGPDLDVALRKTYPNAQASLVARSAISTIQRLNRRRTSRQ